MTARAPVIGKRPFRMLSGISRVEDLANGYSALDLEVQGAKTVYYVEANAGNDGNDGLSWDTPMKTLAVAIAASHADISSGARGWASQNVIFIKGDYLEEDLVALPQKTTIIGCGSADGLGPARLKGVQTIATGTWVGTKFYNVDFQADAATTVMITLPTGAAGIEFHNCRWLPGNATTTGVLATGVTGLKFYNCEFLGWWDSGFTTACISLANNGSNTVHGQEIVGCLFHNSAATGPALLTVANSGGDGCYFRNNQVFCKAKAIDDVSDTFFVLDNIFVTDAGNADNTGTNFNILHAGRNFVTGSNGSLDTPNMA
jgi:hypothetical protein